jgi:hypothetical protein
MAKLFGTNRLRETATKLATADLQTKLILFANGISTITTDPYSATKRLVVSSSITNTSLCKF